MPFGFSGLMGAKTKKTPVSKPSNQELSRLKSEYDEVVAKLSKECSAVGTAPEQRASVDAAEQKPAASGKSDHDERAGDFEEITVVENWIRFLKANAELLVLYGLIEVTFLLPRSPHGCLYEPLLSKLILCCACPHGLCALPRGSDICHTVLRELD